MNALTEAIHNPDDYQQKALTTWYQPDDPRYLDPRHPLIKLAGEAGELTDLYGKEEYKPNFSWWDCKKCKKGKELHHTILAIHDGCQNYTPLVLDELGDYFYYLRILTWQKQVTFTSICKEFEEGANKWYYSQGDLLYSLSCLNWASSELLIDWVRKDVNKIVTLGGLKDCTFYLLAILSKLDCTLDRLTELNYQKLNSEPSAHGWKNV